MTVQFLVDARTWLEHLHPNAPVFALVAIIWLPQYLIRRFAPKMWESAATLPFRLLNVDPERVPLASKAWQALPSVALAALAQALSAHLDAWQTVTAALYGLLAPAWHELLKALPGPYLGGIPPAADPPPKSQG